MLFFQYRINEANMDANLSVKLQNELEIFSTIIGIYNALVGMFDAHFMSGFC